MASRIYVAGHPVIERDGLLVDQRALAGRQGRLALVYLVLHRGVPVARENLASAIWGDDPPAESENALNAILSKLRGAFRKAGFPERTVIEAAMGTVTLRLPAETRVDVEEAVIAIDEAEGAMRGGDRQRAWGNANVAVTIARRPLLPNEEAPWLQARRDALRGVLVRGLQVLAELSAVNGEPALAIEYANESVERAPFRETGYQQLMRLHALVGNRAEALRVYARLRELLRDELGTSPSPQTEAVYMEILTA